MSYNELNQFNSPNYTPASESRAVFGLPRTIDGITIHWWGDPNQGATLQGIVNYLCRANGNSSAHVVLSGTNRQVAWIVNADDVAWHAGNARGNATTIGIEADPQCRNEDYDVLAEQIADIWIYYGRKLPLYPHRYWANTACPGNYDMNRITNEANAWYLRKTQPTPVVVPPATVPVPDAVKLPAPVKYKVTKDPTSVWDLTTNPNYKAVKTLAQGSEFVAFAKINFNNTVYYVTEYSFNKGIKAGVNNADLMEIVSDVTPTPTTPPVQTTPEPPVTPPIPTDPPIVTPPVEPPIVEKPNLLKALWAFIQAILGVFGRKR